MTERVLGHGATCCGECDLCAPTPTPFKEKKRPAVEVVDAAPVEETA